MDALFQKRFDRLNKLLLDYEEEIKGLNSVQLNQNHPNGGWSINQVIYHMWNVEIGTILYIQKKMLNPSETKRSGIKSFYRAALLRYALRSKRKFRAPKVLTEPTGPYNAEELFSQWRITRNELEKLFDSIPSKYKKHQFFKHPVVGKINLKQTLGFMGDHMQRHLDQIKDVKKNINV